MDISVMSDEKNLKIICIIDGCKFNFQKLLSNYIQIWSCTKRMCYSYFELNKNSDIIFRELNNSHEKDDDNIILTQKKETIN